MEIIKRVAANKYKYFGMYLLNDKNMTEVDLLERHYFREGTGPEGITEAIIKKWLVSGSTPRTYKHLIDCIRNCGLGALAEDIENTLSGIHVAIICHMKQCNSHLCECYCIPVVYHLDVYCACACR